MSMSEWELEEIEKRAEAATEGEWIVTLGSGDNLCTAIHSEDETGSMTFIADFLPDWALKTAEKDHVPNMEFCLHARQDIPSLVSEVRRSHTEAAARIKEIEFLRQQLSITTQERDQWDGNYCDLRLEMDKLETEVAELRERLQEEEE